MKKMLFLAAFAATALTASAQQNQVMQKGDKQEMRAMREKMTPEQRADMQAKMMQKKLGLTDDQTMRIRDINMKFMPSKQDREERKAQMQEMGRMIKEREAAYAQVLNAQQMADYQKMREERKEKMKMRHDLGDKAPMQKGDMQEMRKEKR